MGVLETILLILGLVVGVVLLLVLAYYMGKYKSIVPIVFGVVGIIFFGFSVYCMVDLNYYYTAEGGIYGVVSNLFHANKVEGENLEFSLKNVALTQVDGDIYSARVTIDRTITFEDDNQYVVKVNGVPATTSNVTLAYAQATYNYTFYNENLTIKNEDTLTFSFAFYPNYTALNVTTNGGSSAVKLWNEYFQKNNFDVTIEPSNFDTSTSFTEGDISNYAMLTYIIDYEVYSIQIYQNTQAVTLETAPEKEGYFFSHWADDNGEAVKSIDKLTSDKTLHAVYIKQLSDGEYTATATYALVELGFSAEHGYLVDVEINFKIENALLTNYSYTVTPTFDFEEQMGVSYEEYLASQGESVRGALIQSNNTFTFTMQGGFRSGEQVVISYDDASDAWSVTNNLMGATNATFEEVA